MAAALVLAGLALAGSDLESGVRQLNRVREGLEGTEVWPVVVRVGLHLLDAVAANLRGSAVDALRATDQLRGALDAAESAGRAVPPELPALLALVRARAHLWAGDFDAAEDVLVPAVDELERSGCEAVRVRLVGYLAFANALWGRLRRAARLGREAVAGSERLGLVVNRHVPVATVALAWTYLDEYNVAEARQAIRAVAAGVVQDPLVRAAVDLIRVRLLRGRGEYAAAGDAIGQLRAGVRGLPGWFDRMLDITRASIPLGGQRNGPGVGPEAAPANGSTPANGVARANGSIPTNGSRSNGSAPPDDPVLDDLVAAIAKQENVPLEVRVVGQLLVSRKELESGHEAVARAALEKALRLAKAENLRRPIIEAPARVRGLLRGSPDLAERHRWLGTALVSPPRRRIPGTGTAPAIIDPLTHKEQEVLDNLAQLLSTDEIARKMFVSVNTVKTHVRKILRKLAVSRRNDAIRRARELGLLRSEPP
jgi:LuxR family maltose regulon positive regulatory protein